jgi:hypothetical protein
MLAFKPFRDGVWVLDPGLVDRQDAVKRMRGNFGLR